MLFPTFNPAALGLSGSRLVSFDGTKFTSAEAVFYATSGTHLLATAQAATVVPLAVRATAGQTANLQEWRDSNGSVIARVDASGRGYFGGASEVQLGNFGSGFPELSVPGGTMMFRCNTWFLQGSGNTIFYMEDVAGSNTRKINNLNLRPDGINSERNANLVLRKNQEAVAGTRILDVIDTAAASNAILFSVEQDGKIRTNQTSSGTTLGSVTNKMPVYNASGTLVGYAPLYDSIT